jgi:hypothetical protein
MDYIINDKRFKKKFNQNQLSKYLYKQNRIVQFPQYLKNYYNFFNLHAKEKYKLVNNDCLCGEKNDILLSQTDRHCVDFVTVVCKNCGLIRAKDYFKSEDVEDFYKNFYRTITLHDKYGQISAADMFDIQKKESKFRFDLINKYKIKPINELKIVDLGGGVGGILDHFHDSNEKYLLDYYDPYLNYAETKGIKSIKGGLNKIDFKPDIIILSHVIEHWSNFKYEIQRLIDIQKKNETLNYIEFPGVDSIKKGRREGDVLGDIQVPHVYYFTSYVFENLMNRYGFKKIYIDSLIKSIFIYTGEKINLVNYFELCRNDLISAEKTRKLQIFKNLIKFFIPIFILKIIRKIRNKKIEF